MVQCRRAVRRSTKCVDCKLTLTLVRRVTDMSALILVVRLYDQTTGEGVGPLDFLDHNEKSPLQFKLTEDEMVVFRRHQE